MERDARKSGARPSLRTLRIMGYAALIREAFPTLDGPITLARLLDRIDALNKSVPTLAELNEAFAQVAHSRLATTERTDSYGVEGPTPSRGLVVPICAASTGDLNHALTAQPA
jgi:hypothetical protein